MAKPTLGYKTRTDAVFALMEQGHSQRAVGEKLGITQAAVSGLIASRGRTRDNRPRTEALERDGGLFPVDVRMALRPAAAKRGMTTDRLIAEIIALVAFEGLADAILDDMGSLIE